MYFRYCPDCGKKNIHDDHFCGACGRDLTDLAPRPRFAPSPRPVYKPADIAPDPIEADLPMQDEVGQEEWSEEEELDWDEPTAPRADTPDNDQEKQLQTYFDEAARGDVDAQYELGLCYEFGDGVAKNTSTAFSWFCSAAKKGDARAQLKVALCYQFGQGVHQSDAEAVLWFRRAADQGDMDAQFNLGRCYELGAGVEPDWDKAAYWYRKAADQGDFLAREALVNLQ